jgi:RNA recognition motif-containing protein
MSSNYSTQTSRRSSRGGRRRSRQGSEGGSSSLRSNRPARKELRKLTLWEKFLALFGVKPSPPAKTASHSDRPRSASEDRPAPAPRASRPSIRTPESVEVTTPRIYVGNLSFDATESDLLDLFNGVGIVQNVEVVSNRQTQRSKGFAFVQMQTIEEAKRAVAELHDKEYMGRKLVVSGAKAVETRSGDRDRSRQSEPQPEPQPEQPSEQ